MYLVFYDGECPFCQKAVTTLKRKDREGRLNFAPLKSELALQHGIVERGELVFYDHGKLYQGGKGVLRIFWRLGGWYSILGILSFLPGAVFRPFYRWVAKRRYRL